MIATPASVERVENVSRISHRSLEHHTGGGGHFTPGAPGGRRPIYSVVIFDFIAIFDFFHPIMSKGSINIKH